MSMTPSGVEPATFRFVAQHLNHCSTAVPAFYVDRWNYFPINQLLCFVFKSICFLFLAMDTRLKAVIHTNQHRFLIAVKKAHFMEIGSNDVHYCIRDPVRGEFRVTHT